VKRISVAVGADHIDSLARARKPLLAVIELIWNALDADAKKVAVILTPNGLSGLDSIQIEDDGTGIPPEEFDSGFGQLGDSWKRRSERTKVLGRALHGKKGIGRYRALSLGGSVIWKTRFEVDEQVLQYEIAFDAGDRRTVTATDPAPSSERPGTIVTISNPSPKLETLEFDVVKPELTEHFALYLRQYPNVELRYDGSVVNPTELISRTTDIPFDFMAEDGQLAPQILTVIEWRVPLERSLFLCSRDGFSLRETVAGIQAPGLQFTAYLRSELLEKFEAQDSIEIELGDLGKLLELTREKLREYSASRQAEQAAEQVEEWKQEEIYPYEGIASDAVEVAKRQVFDVVAQNVEKYLPDFKGSKKKSKQFTFNLLRQAIETSPSSLRKILEEVIGLPKEKRDQLAILLEKTSLVSIINASKIVSDRLEFIQGLKSMLYDSPYRDKLLERKQLQRLVAENTWLFGDEYLLMNDDESLLNVLKKHLGNNGYSIDEGLIDFTEDVTFEGGGTGIVDLALTSEPSADENLPGTVLGKTLPRSGVDPVHNLVIELKRPSQRITPAVLKEVRDYAYAIARDERFHSVPARWTFWALSNAISEQAQEEAMVKNLPPGVVYQSGIVAGRNYEYTVIAKTWAQVLDQATQRLNFFRTHIGYSPSFSQGREYLNAVYRKFIPLEAQTSVDSATPVEIK
jgi:hypothetical protein